MKQNNTATNISGNTFEGKAGDTSGGTVGGKTGGTSGGELTVEELRSQLQDAKQQLAEMSEQHDHHLAMLAHANRTYSSITLGVGLSHEVKQPLGAIVNYVQACLHMLEQGHYNTEELQDIMARACHESHRAADLIERLRRFISKREPRRSTLNFNHSVLETIALLQLRMREHDIRIELDMADDLPLIIGDRIQLEQVSFNLLNNAIDILAESNADDRRIHITTGHTDDDHIHLVVRDWGGGMDDETKDKIFEPFFSTKAHGMGLGLAVSHAIIAAHQGSIELQVEKNQGCSFKVLLPIQNKALPEDSLLVDGVSTVPLF